MGQLENLVLGLGEPLIAPLVPQPLRDDIMLLWALDRRLAELARAGKEPALRQIKLRWWSEQLAVLAPGLVPTEPLLAMVGERLLDRVRAAELVALADAWENEAIGEVDPSGERGALLFALTARLLGQGDVDVAAAGRLWALVERGLAEGRLPDGLSTSLEMSGVGMNASLQIAHVEALDCRQGRALGINFRQGGSRDTSRIPRALAALTALARGIARRGGVRSRWREQLLVFRVGLIGR